MVRRGGPSGVVPPDRAALLAERARLLERVAEIERQITRRERAVVIPPETRAK